MASIFSIRTKPDEPYLTQVLSYVLGSDRRFCAFVLETVFGLGPIDRIFKVVAEEREEGIQPDIRIDCQIEGRPARVAIENKIDAPFHAGQIPGYKGICDYVVVLYRSLADPEQGRSAHGLCSWATLCLRSREYLNRLDSDYGAVHRFKVEELIGYLEDSGMGIGKVTWEIENGMTALRNLFDQVEEALGRLVGDGTLSGWSSAGSATKNYHGWKVFLHDDAFRVYVLYSPIAIVTYFDDMEGCCQQFDALSDVYPSFGELGQRHLDSLRIAEGHFLCLSVDEQLATIEQSLRRATEARANA